MIREQPKTHATWRESLAVSNSVAPNPLTVPDVSGQDGATVRRNLEDFGFSDVTLTSANPKYGTVMLAANWTAVSIEPPPGTVVTSGDPIVVRVYRE
jgi:beta-lactam-binding protein with PASTA domain